MCLLSWHLDHSAETYSRTSVGLLNEARSHARPSAAPSIPDAPGNYIGLEVDILEMCAGTEAIRYPDVFLGPLPRRPIAWQPPTEVAKMWVQEFAPGFPTTYQAPPADARSTCDVHGANHGEPWAVNVNWNQPSYWVKQGSITAQSRKPRRVSEESTGSLGSIVSSMATDGCSSGRGLTTTISTTPGPSTDVSSHRQPTNATGVNIDFAPITVPVVQPRLFSVPQPTVRPRASVPPGFNTALPSTNSYVDPNLVIQSQCLQEQINSLTRVCDILGQQVYGLRLPTPEIPRALSAWGRD